MLRQLEERHPQAIGPAAQPLQLVRPKQPQHPPAPQRQPPALKPYQLKPKRGQETFIEPPVEWKEVPPPRAKQIKCIKKKLDELNKKIIHSNRKHNHLIRKKIEGPSKLEESREPEESFNPVELEQAFDSAYRSYRINGGSRILVDTFFNQIKQNLIDLISRELIDSGSARVQTTVWIRFRIEYEHGIIDRVRLPFIVG